MALAGVTGARRPTSDDGGPAQAFDVAMRLSLTTQTRASVSEQPSTDPLWRG
ncbi:Hypothetical protein I596_862 [Dokdonella koreensis DS-123]|uniref:Uncharacterized protein n=1 Tax=Dokdonella koreensis DS-123 TaxID=1300342 RepID=A0A160DTH4_9GAMM|nr:Hypothetical protein I596_862 [Dokdonella koreensis DS-123]